MTVLRESERQWWQWVVIVEEMASAVRTKPGSSGSGVAPLGKLSVLLVQCSECNHLDV